MIIKKIIEALEEFAPKGLQEKWDNSGVQLGDTTHECQGVVLTVDVTEHSLKEAIACGANLIVSHHPLIFTPLKSIEPSSGLGRIVFEAIKHDIVIYSGHTSFDSTAGGVSFIAAQKLGLKNCRVLVPQKNTLRKLVVYVPESYAGQIEKAAFEAGAGTIGSYDCCGFTLSGKGSFRAGEAANPFVGRRGELHREPEIRFETVLPEFRVSDVLKAVSAVHPYEEVAYDIFDLQLADPRTGIGVIGDLDPVGFDEFVLRVKEAFGLDYVRCSSAPRKQTISRVALTGGSGGGFIADAQQAGADVYLTGDLKYHDFQRSDSLLTVMDIGHFESEKFIIEIFYDILTKKIHNFATHIVADYRNPIDYL